MTTEDKYWFTNRYCFHCKKVTVFIRCENCGKWFCRTHGIHVAPEIGDYGSIISPASIVHGKC